MRRQGYKRDLFSQFNMGAKDKQTKWWEDRGGFFGNQYMIGDNSIEGYIPGKKESLEQRTNREVDGIISLLNPRPHAWILDVPCGYGRHTIELRKRGYFTSGVDINEEFLKIAKEQAKVVLDYKHPWEIPNFEKRDMRTLEYYSKYIGKLKWINHFDFLINMFYSFGFFSDEENKATMKTFYDALNKERGGKLLLHTDVSPEMILQGDYRLSEIRSLKDDKKLIIREEYDPKTKRINGSWTILNNGDSKRLTPYSKNLFSKRI